MNSYLPLGRGAHRWVVPLWDSTAVRLAAALVERNQAARCRILADQLSGDPALLLWTVCRADAQRTPPIETIEQVAEWLAEQDLLSLLADIELDRNGASAEQYAPLVDASLARAAESSKQQQLLAMLADAPQWIELGGGQLDQALPSWLGKLIANVKRSPAHKPDSLGCELLAPEDGAGERLSALVEQLRRLAKLESQFAVELQQSKLDAMKELAYGAGHELNNPLANISTRAQVLLRDEEDPERRRKLAAINAQAFRGHEMIADLMLYARPPKMTPVSVDLDAALNQMIEEIQPVAHERQTELVRVGDESPVSVVVDSNQLKVAMAAIVKNAMEVLGIGGRVEVELECVGDFAEIHVRDNGPGIEPAVLPHIFDPFFSGREAGRGLGFGLSKAWRIVTNHGGTLIVDSQAGRGATFTVRLPVEREADLATNIATISE